MNHNFDGLRDSGKLLQTDPALCAAVMFTGAAYLPKLRAMTFEERRVLAEQLAQQNSEMPLHMALSKSEQQQLSFPAWMDGELLTGPQTIALMVFTLWCQVDENPAACGALWETWPIMGALILADGPQALKNVEDKQKKGECAG